ncbi:SDR family NAD(P)-dependent oxidoreductase, partial [Chryseobacterium sp. SIMBA_028]|uniref:SDR family NAD(P)-dependent oxidoreductase n=1 Tax=Chryseobacterium sp. SIMBA_028 TaxID=3085771 RepID=UPI0039792D14
LVTGAASGIGLEIAREFAIEGAKVVISDLNEKAVHHAAEELKGQGYEVLSAVCDVTNEEQVEKSVSKTLETFGRLDILVNNAGIQHVSDIENFP